MFVFIPVRMKRVKNQFFFEMKLLDFQNLFQSENIFEIIISLFLHIHLKYYLIFREIDPQEFFILDHIFPFILPIIKPKILYSILKFLFKSIISHLFLISFNFQSTTPLSFVVVILIIFMLLHKF